MQPQIVHEAEVHRQHVRLRIPLTVEMDGVSYAVDDWSLGGFGIEASMTSRQPGEQFTARLTFPFEGFEIAMALPCEVVYIVNDNSRFGCRFLSLGQDQVSLFRYIVDAYLSGEIVSAGDILQVRGRDNTAIARERAVYNPYEEFETMGAKVRRYLGYLGLGLVTAALCGIVYFGVKDRFFTVKARSAIVDASMHNLRLPRTGTIDVNVEDGLIARGQQLAMVTDDTGERSALSSPCDCVVVNWNILSGQFGFVGDPAVVLTDADRPPSVVARVDIDQIEQLSLGQGASIKLPGQSGWIDASIERIDTRSFDPDGTVSSVVRQARVRLIPETPLDLETIGTAVSVRFD